MLLLGQSYGLVKLTLSVSINIVMNFKHNYWMKLVVVWEKYDRLTLSYTYSFTIILTYI